MPRDLRHQNFLRVVHEPIVGNRLPAVHFFLPNHMVMLTTICRKHLFTKILEGLCMLPGRKCGDLDVAVHSHDQQLLNPLHSSLEEVTVASSRWTRL